MKTLSLKDQYWKDHINKWKSSGLSQANYCRKAGINFKSFSSRKSSFKKQGVSSTEELFIPVKKTIPKKIIIKLSSGLELLFDELPEVNWFGKFIKQLGDINVIN